MRPATTRASPLRMQEDHSVSLRVFPPTLAAGCGAPVPELTGHRCPAWLSRSLVPDEIDAAQEEPGRGENHQQASKKGDGHNGFHDVRRHHPESRQHPDPPLRPARIRGQRGSGRRRLGHPAGGRRSPSGARRARRAGTGRPASSSPPARSARATASATSSDHQICEVPQNASNSDHRCCGARGGLWWRQ